MPNLTREELERHRSAELAGADTQWLIAFIIQLERERDALAKRAEGNQRIGVEFNVSQIRSFIESQKDMDPDFKAASEAFCAQELKRSGGSPAPAAPSAMPEPTAWRREWDGDVSDLGKFVYAEHGEELDQYGPWEPLYSASALDLLRAQLQEERSRSSAAMIAIEARDEQLTKLESALAAAQAEAREMRGAVVALWKLLDDIDTLDDAAKDNDTSFRNRCYIIQRKRFLTISGDKFDEMQKMQ